MKKQAAAPAPTSKKQLKQLPTQLKVCLGKKVEIIPINPITGLDSQDIQTQLDFTPEQFLYLQIIGLKNKTTDEVIPMERDPILNDPMCTCVSMEHLLNINTKDEYEVLYEGKYSGPSLQ